MIFRNAYGCMGVNFRAEPRLTLPLRQRIITAEIRRFWPTTSTYRLKKAQEEPP